MKKQILLVICLVLLIGTVLAVDMTNVGDWWGTVKISGEYSNGAVLDAYINNVKVASKIVGAIEPNYYLIHVEGTVGDSIVFKVNGKEATTQIWSNGDHELNLEVSIDINTNDDNNDGGSSGGGGGGSNTQDDDDQVIVVDEQEDEEEEESEIEVDSPERTVGTGTGAVVGFIKSAKGIGLGIGLVFLIAGSVVFLVQKNKGKSNETELPTTE